MNGRSELLDSFTSRKWIVKRRAGISTEYVLETEGVILCEYDLQCLLPSAAIELH